MSPLGSSALSSVNQQVALNRHLISLRAELPSHVLWTEEVLGAHTALDEWHPMYTTHTDIDGGTNQALLAVVTCLGILVGLPLSSFPRY